jgi:signal transduction histidine kinase
MNSNEPEIEMTQSIWDQMRAELRTDGLPQLDQACHSLLSGSLGPLNARQIEDLASIERSATRLTRLVEGEPINWSDYGEAAHALRGPLNLTIGFSRLMLKGIDGPINEAQRAALQTIHGASRRLLALFNLLLDALLLAGNGIRFAMEPVPVDQILDKFIAAGHALADNRGIVFEADVTPQLTGITVRSDEKRLTQALSALLAVSVKYTSDGVVTLRAALRERHLLVHLENQGCQLPEPLLADLQCLLTDATDLSWPCDARLRLGLAWHLVTGLKGTLEAQQVGQTCAFTVTIPVNQSLKCDQQDDSEHPVSW